MNRIVGKTLTAVRFQNEYYDQGYTIEPPCFKNSAQQLLFETLSGKIFSFYPDNERIDYELGFSEVFEVDDLLNPVTLEPGWNSFIGKKITEIQIIKEDAESITGAKLTFGTGKPMYIVCGDYEYNTALSDFVVIPRTSGILVFLSSECYRKYSTHK